MTGLLVTKKTALCIAAFAFFSFTLTGQFTETGLNEPPGLKWKKIETEYFTVVFPESLILEAKKAAGTADRFFKRLLEDSGTKPKPLTLVLSNQGISSNGYFRLAPRLAEWFHMPTSSHLTGVVDWYELLAAHEGRHVVQFEELNCGWVKIAGILMGELGRSAASFQAAPLWFFEGDSVAAETELTTGGRGRSPAFDLDIRTLLLSGIRYGYRKAYFGSYKDFYPDLYHLGYLLVAHAQKACGPEVLHNLFRASALNSNFLFPFAEAVQQEMNISVRELYEEAMNDLEAFWTEHQSGLTLIKGQRINSREGKIWTNYMFPRFDSDGSIYIQKTGLDIPMTLCRLYRDGREERITLISPHQGFFNRLSIGGGKACWSEAVPDARWGKRVFSDIVVLDIKTKKRRRVSRRRKLFEPSLSPDGKRLAAVEFLPERLCTLVLLDSETGEEIQRFLNPQNDFLMMPSWSEDGKKIVLVQQGREGRILALAEPVSGRIRALTPHSFENITHPVIHGNHVLFNSPCSGIDNIHALDLKNLRRNQVTSSRFGAFFADISPDGQSLVYCDYSVSGYEVLELPFEPSAWRAMESAPQKSLPFFEPAGEGSKIEISRKKEEPPEGDYEVKNYSLLSHVLNLHSWVPFPIPPDLGLYLFSNDKLNTAALSAGVNYNLNEEVLGFEAGGTYSGLFPLVDFGLGYGGRSTTYEDEEGRTVTYGWKETYAAAGLGVPLDLSRGVYRTSLFLASSLSMIEVSGRERVESFENGNGLLVPLSHELHFSRFRKSAYRDLKPRWGQMLSIVYSHTPWKSDYRGSLASIQSGLYAPGLFKHHSLVLQGAFERQCPDNYRFSSRVLFPRGFDYIHHDSFLKVSVDYAFPLAYPDFALDGILYFKRLRGILFYDRLTGETEGERRIFTSCGFELMNDFHLFNIPVQLEAGIRLAYRFLDRTFRVELVLFDLFYDSLRTKNRR